MAQQSTLLAYLIPKVTSQVEDAATDALAFILNRSAACRKALDRLLESQGFQPEPLVRVETQVAEDDKSRPDMVGYDQEARKCFLVEAKFWAALQEDQATRYFEKLDKDGPSVLMFICPDSRIETLWAEILRQIEGGENGVRLDKLDSPGRTRRAGAIGANQHLLLVSWAYLLESMKAAVPTDSASASDIRQLRGLAKYQDEEAFLPIHPQELGLAYPRRIRGLHRLINHTIRRGRSEKWITTKGLRATPQREGYGRYFAFTAAQPDSAGGPVGQSLKIAPGYLFLGVNYQRWVSKGETPLWLRVNRRVPVNRERLRKEVPWLTDYIRPGTFTMPIHLPTMVEYQNILDDVVRQIKAVARTVESASLDA